MIPIIEVQQIQKKYKSLTAVSGLDLSIPEGICFGLLGPNGAGKTTLIEIMEDIIPPTSGEVLYKGKARSDAFRQDIGIMFQQTALLSFMTVRETLETFQKLYRKPAEIDSLIEQCALGDITEQMNDKISGGQRQRLLMALSLVNQPKLLFLDEPTTGLDPQARRNLWDLVNAIKKEGKTVILTTHYMEEAEFLCDEIAIMDQGRIIARGSPESLIKTHCRRARLKIPKRNFTGAPIKLPMPFISENDHIEIPVDDINDAIGELMAQGIPLNDMFVITPNLESVFLNLTGKRLRD
ncbi:MAG: ABC transporter ATP-binding protein [Desulfobacteraceae bacterium]|nr:ABC transporter ATP-binding protein [Desulfobacteraceae bacterium]